MPCRYRSCQNPEEIMVMCSLNDSHTAHLSCWARWSAAQNVAGSEEICPVEPEDCFGSATSQDRTDDATKTLIVDKMRELGVSARVLQGGDGGEGDAVEFTFDEPGAGEDVGPAQAQAQLALRCNICYADLVLNDAGDDYVAGTAWWCSGHAAHRDVLYCTDCKNAQGFCATCATYALVQASIAVPPVALAYEFPFIYEIMQCRGSGKQQTGMLCYAAATATAILWSVGRDLSIYECMHEFAISAQSADDEACAEYRSAYASATSVEPWSAMSVIQVIDNVFRVYDDYIRIFDNVQATMGSPVFPNGVNSQLHTPSMTNEALRAAIMGNKPVIKGASVHWTVIFGIRGANENNIASVMVYDPMTNAYRDEAWSPATNADYFVVG